jgi:hypothetical protein
MGEAEIVHAPRSCLPRSPGSISAGRSGAVPDVRIELAGSDDRACFAAEKAG